MGSLWTPRWVLVHATVVVLVLGMLGLCWWQVDRAANGNLLSYGYAVEWPAFAAFTIYVWIKEMRQGPRRGPGADGGAAAPARSASRTGPAYDDTGDDELAAYNRYLAWRNENPHASRSDYPGQ